MNLEFLMPIVYLLASYLFFIKIKKKITFKTIDFIIEGMPSIQIMIAKTSSQNNNLEDVVISVANQLSNLDAIMIKINYGLYIVMPLIIILYFTINGIEIPLYILSIFLVTLSIIMILFVGKIDKTILILKNKVGI